jgi:hypothetical protein
VTSVRVAPPEYRDDRPWWQRATSGAARTWRALTGRGDDNPTAMQLVLTRDGQAVYVPVREPAPRAARAARAWWRRRRTLAPLAVAPLYGALALAGMDWRMTALAAVAAPLVAAGTWVAILGGPDGKARTAVLVAGGILAFEAWWLLHLPPAGLAVFTAAACVASSWRYRIREKPPEPAHVDDDRPWQIARWESEVATAPPGEQPILPGAIMVGAEDIYAPDDPEQWVGFEAGIQLVRRRQEVAHVRQRLGLIAGVYNAAKAGTIVEEVGDEARCRLIVTVRRFLEEIKEYSGPTLDRSTGRFVMQVLGDGSHGYWQLWMPRQGVRHGWIVGATNGGKSGAMDCLLANLLSCGLAVVDYVDLKGGASGPHWRHRALRFGKRAEDGIAALRRGAFLCDWRNEQMARMPAVDERTGKPITIDGHPALGRTWVDPSETWPIYAVIIEEWPQLINDPVHGREALFLAERIASLGRQACVMLVIISQGANLDAVFKNSRVLRTNVQAGNTLILWTDQGSGNLATATRTVDLRKLPEGQPGVSYLIGPGQPRDLMGRVPWVRQQWDVVKAAIPGNLAPDALAILDAADVISSGGSLELAAQVAHARIKDPEWAAVVDELFRPGVTMAPMVAAAGKPSKDPDAVSYAPGMVLGQSGGDGDEHTASQRLILSTLARGESSTMELRVLLGGAKPISDQALRGHLDPLIAAELVVRPGHGRYALAVPDLVEA